MNPLLSGAAAILAKNDQLLPATLKGIDDTAYRQVLLPGTSSMAWILGHMTGSRFLMNKLLGGTEKSPNSEPFHRGATDIDHAALPTVDEIMALWTSMAEILPGRLDSAPDEVLNAAGPEGLPSMDGTILGNLTFLALHESYHLGQLGLLRKASGQPGLAG